MDAGLKSGGEEKKPFTFALAPRDARQGSAGDVCTYRVHRPSEKKNSVSADPCPFPPLYL